MRPEPGTSKHVLPVILHKFTKYSPVQDKSK